MKSTKIVSSVLTLMVAAPIWYYLLYQVLVRVEASELMMFLFWVYVPVGIVATLLGKLVEADSK